MVHLKSGKQSTLFTNGQNKPKALIIVSTTPTKCVCEGWTKGIKSRPCKYSPYFESRAAYGVYGCETSCEKRAKKCIKGYLRKNDNGSKRSGVNHAGLIDGLDRCAYISAQTCLWVMHVWISIRNYFHEERCPLKGN